MYASVSTSPVRQSCAMHGTRPRSSNAMAESGMSSGDCRARSVAGGGPPPAADRARAALDGDRGRGRRGDLQLAHPRVGPGRRLLGTPDARPAALEDRLPADPGAQELALAHGLLE